MLLLMIIAGLFSIWASWHVNSTYKKYEKVRSMSGLSGAEAAERILQSQGIFDVSIERVSGNLTDHYDPRSKTLRLSDSTFGNRSVAAVGVAAHECGHALQHAKGYGPLELRSKLVPLANIGSNVGIWIFMIGLMFSAGDLSNSILTIGIILFSAAVLFQVVTLPVEFDASSRALRLLEMNGILGSDEVSKSRKVLGAAALTYVAAAASAIIQLIRLVLIARGRDND